MTSNHPAFRRSLGVRWRFNRFVQSNAAFIVMLTPAVVLYIVFVLYPLLGGAYYSLTNWTGIDTNYAFVGLRNYVRIFSETRTLTPLKNTFVYAFSTTIIVNIIALLIAIGLDHPFRLKNFMRATIYIPNVLSTLIVGYVWSFIFTEPVADLGKKLGIDLLAYNVLGSHASLFAVSFVTLWQSAGWYMVVYLAGLQTIDQSLYEAAIVDGAGAWGKFIHITVPCMVPAFTVNMVIALLRTFKQFDLIFSMTYGGPGNASETISMFIYKESFTNYNTGYASAVGIVLFVIIVILSLAQILLFRKAEDNVNE